MTTAGSHDIAQGAGRGPCSRCTPEREQRIFTEMDDYLNTMPMLLEAAATATRPTSIYASSTETIIKMESVVSEDQEDQEYQEDEEVIGVVVPVITPEDEDEEIIGVPVTLVDEVLVDVLKKRQPVAAKSIAMCSSDDNISTFSDTDTEEESNDEEELMDTGKDLDLDEDDTEKVSDDEDDTEKVSDDSTATSTTTDVNVYVGSSDDDDIEVVERILKRRRAVKMAAQKRDSTTKLSDNQVTLKGLRSLEEKLDELSKSYKPFPMNYTRLQNFPIDEIKSQLKNALMLKIEKDVKGAVKELGSTLKVHHFLAYVFEDHALLPLSVLKELCDIFSAHRFDALRCAELLYSRTMTCPLAAVLDVAAVEMARPLNERNKGQDHPRRHV